MQQNIIFKIELCALTILVLGSAQTVIYIDPPRIPQKAIGEQCTLKIRIRNAANIFGWQAGLFFDPNVLEGVSVAEDSFLKYAHGIEHDTWWLPYDPPFNNTEGYLHYQACTYLNISDSGGVDEGPLMQVVFKVKGTGNSILDLTQAPGVAKAVLANNNVLSFEFICQDGFYGTEDILPMSSFAINTESGHQMNPAVAWNNSANEFLVVWEDYEGKDILGQRVSSAGSLVEPVIYVEYSMFRLSSSPNVSWNGTNYLVVYTSRNIFSPQGDYDIRAVMVSADGTPGSEFTIADDARYQGFPIVAWNGTNHLVVWQDFHNEWTNPEIYGQLVDVDGNLVGGNFTIAATSNIDLYPRVVTDGVNYLMIWAEGDNTKPYGPIYGQRIDAEGTLIGSPFQISTGAIPDVAYDGINYLVVYQKATSSIEWNIYGIRISSTGSLVGSEFAINTASNDQTMPKVIYESASAKYVVNWVSEQSMPAIWRQAVNTNGTLFYGPSIQADASYHQIFPALTYGGSTGNMVVWADLRSGSDFDIYGCKTSLIGKEEESQNLEPESQISRLVVYPNPFSKLTNISFGRVHGEKGMGQGVELKIYDSSGRVVKDFSSTTPYALRTTLSWDDSDDSNRKLPSGVYFLKFEAGDYKTVKKLLLIK